jgi:mono/diheme cytochrome c family protein
MAPVVHNLGGVPEDDVRAIAVFIASVAGSPSPERQRMADELIQRLSNPETVGLAADRQPGAAIFAGACATCHSETRLRGAAGAINLALSTAVNAPDPRNTIRIVLDGIGPAQDRRGPLMPGFSGALTDGHIAQLIGYVRAQFSTQPAWRDLETTIRRIREGKDQS